MSIPNTVGQAASRQPLASCLRWLALACFATISALAQNTGSGLWVIADFNGDHHPDVANLSGAAREPNVQFGSLSSDAFALSHVSPMQKLRARDLDGDADRDLVLENAASVAIAVWINDGHGNFAPGNVEDFRSQLSREGPQGCTASASLSAADWTDDGSRGSLALPVLKTAPQATDALSAGTVNRKPHSSFRSGPGARGPPLRS